MNRERNKDIYNEMEKECFTFSSNIKLSNHILKE